MARSRRLATYLTNAYYGACAVCSGRIRQGQSAVVRQDGRGASHAVAGDCNGR